jgi:hypothetical protein
MRSAGGFQSRDVEDARRQHVFDRLEVVRGGDDDGGQACHEAFAKKLTDHAGKRPAVLVKPDRVELSRFQLGRLRLSPCRDRFLQDAAVVRPLNTRDRAGRQRPRVIHVVAAHHADVLGVRKLVAKALDRDRGVDISSLCQQRHEFAVDPSSRAGLDQWREHRAKSIDADVAVYGDGVQGLVRLDENQLSGDGRAAVGDPALLEPAGDRVPVPGRGDDDDVFVRRQPFADE